MPLVAQAIGRLRTVVEAEGAAGKQSHFKIGKDLIPRGELAVPKNLQYAFDRIGMKRTTGEKN